MGLYYITKPRTSSKERVVKGEGRIFYSTEEVEIAFNEKQLDLNAVIKCRLPIKQEDGSIKPELIETTCGRVLFNKVVPEEAGFINELLTKKSLRNIIGDILKTSGIDRCAQFLDDIKQLGFYWAFKGGLSFNIDDVIIPDEKDTLIEKAQGQVDEIMGNYNMGLITNNERYNQIIDVWTHTNSKLTNILMNKLKNDNQGFNSIFMMFDSGARGSKEQIRQLAGMRGLMAKPENPGLLEGLSLRTLFWQTSKKDCRYLSTLYQLTGHVKVWPIQP